MITAFWIRGLNPDDIIDRRAIAESELADYVATLSEGQLCPVVRIQDACDWLDRGVPAEWIADMLATIARYPQCHYYLYSMHCPFWQARIKRVATLDSPGGKIASDWLDGWPPPGLRLGGPADQRSIVDAIPQRPYHPGTRIPVAS